MNSSSIITAIAALCLTSLLVRVLPVICDFQFSPRLLRWMETTLPIAVFLNFIVYLVLQEAQIALGPALVALVITATLAYLNLGGLFVGMLGGCVSYYLLTAW
ncbi:AzlD domain-containing protein [Halomonas aquamarina]|uniref:AzlD domain-containing protein n=1 Tax=Vreelandella aquamarina TaxID=77097 RepID=A0ACC5VXH1_9GAMM|nr:AzlD domain-containing protein [Halomonas aquamarina]MBZ5488367.1 AzlD domain-containing protein [Halomonas aquamarina]